MLIELEGLQTRKKNLSSVIAAGNAVIKHRMANSANLLEAVGSSKDATKRYGKYVVGTDRVKKIVNGLIQRLEQFEKEADSSRVEQAQNLLREINTRKAQLAEVRDYAKQGYISGDIYRKHQQEFEELVQIGATNPLLKSELDTIKTRRKQRVKKEGINN